MQILNRVALQIIALLAAAVPAGAMTYSSSFGAPDPGPATGESIIVDFNGPLPIGYGLSGDFAFTSGTTTVTAAPAGDDTRYLYTSPLVGSGVATLSTLDLASVSFYWGSVDDYNSVEVLGAGGATLFTLAGADFSPANGARASSATNQRVFFTAQGNEVITGLRFTATGIAYEIDDVAGILATDRNPSGIPEPATWALTVTGFAMIGVGTRRRRCTGRLVTG